MWFPSDPNLIGSHACALPQVKSVEGVACGVMAPTQNL